MKDSRYKTASYTFAGCLILAALLAITKLLEVL